MDITELDPVMIHPNLKKDVLDTPDCYGEYNKESKLCMDYCAISIKCCVLHNKNPKIDILEKLLIHNQYAIKLN